MGVDVSNSAAGEQGNKMCTGRFGQNLGRKVPGTFALSSLLARFSSGMGSFFTTRGHQPKYVNDQTTLVELKIS